MAEVWRVEEVDRIRKDVGGPLRDGVSWEIQIACCGEFRLGR